MSSHGSERHDPPASPADHDDTEARLPEHVYRRRRLVALAVVVLLVLALVWAVVAGVRAVTGGGGPEADEQAAAREPGQTARASTDPEHKFADFTPRPTPSGSGSAAPSASPSASATATPECGGELSVTASTDKESYPAKQEPVLAMTLENTGEHPCTVTTGGKRMAFAVVSGQDTVFDSRHCAAEGEDRKITLDAGHKETARLMWNRTRTAEGCPAGQAEALPGYYKLTASLGDVTGPEAAFVLE
ncbi:hypothetical protein [Kocuria tytonis]|uniref:DUF4232 domain-containing protein n=1 Tax=Kocuria tytonis TaxID=2054280 RepID=A0A495A2D5_9MICC|nr:hypothetical protein [Kocuria tytonis]RKQ33657.1 hypothetical protein C1C97_010565 [Kocuria tytonis]